RRARERRGSTIIFSVGPRRYPMNNAEIARAMYRAFAAKDRATVEKLLAEDFHFTSPLDNRLDRATFFPRCWPNSDRLRAFEFLRVVAAGEEVVGTFEGHSTQGGLLPHTPVLALTARP